jgi:hypothetical protein
VVLEHWWCLHKTGHSTRPESCRKAKRWLIRICYRRLAPALLPNQHPRAADRRLWTNLHVWGARLQKIILRKRPRDLTFVHCTTNYTGSQSG